MTTSTVINQKKKQNKNSTVWGRGTIGERVWGEGIMTKVLIYMTFYYMYV